ncbi:hypothetical protein ONZ45_g12333 [Pleurotus djamor]|nr:hypothetical protein ONZ45_g12333 [Pleurotus djamor]
MAAPIELSSTSECDTEDQGTSPFFDDEEEVDELESSRQVSPIPHATDDVSMEMDVDAVAGELRDDVIVISDDDLEPECTKKTCKNNPNCLNYLGQDIWESEEGAAWNEYLANLSIGRDPILESKEPDVPVWFRDLSFRSGVYKCTPAGDKAEEKYKANATLENCIESLLKPERLAGDNQYFCSQCNSLQDATRYTELRELPPVLHFSLLRFVYDLTSMERKKSKQTIAFPKTIDMARYLRPSGSAQGSTQSRPSSKVYHLRGILVHKGPSAYHGHYEAQVYDPVCDAWFRCNDEAVTKITELGDKRPKKKDDDESSENRANKKRRLVEDSDDEIMLVSPPKTTKPPSDISSKDAYMLIYVSADREQERDVPVPPERAMEDVRRLNAAHDEECETFRLKYGYVSSFLNQVLIERQIRKKDAKIAFKTLRDGVLDILKTWQLTSVSEPAVVASADALKEWISKHSVDIRSSQAEKTSDPKPELCTIAVDDILCEHKRLDPSRAQSMKRITQQAYHKIVGHTKYSLSVCINFNTHNKCDTSKNYSTKKMIVLRLGYQSTGSEVCGDGFPKACQAQFLEDWRLAKPKMHVPNQDDPSPSSPEYVSHVACEHGGLSMNTTSRMRINAKATSFLKQLFSSWEPVDGSSEICPVCEAEVHESRGHKLAVRKQAEDEKARLKHMYDNALNGNMALLENVPPNDMDMRLSVVKLVDWQVLSELYSASPLIAIEKRKLPDIPFPRYVCDMGVCEPCCRERQSTWESTEITIRILRTEEEKAKPDIVTYGSLQTGARQSKRLRQVKESGEKRRLNITKQSTVKDIKVMIQSQLNIPTICQRLFYQGKELHENTATAELLGLLANDILDLREENEVHDVDSDIEVEPPTKRQREEGGGFGGTLLASSQPSSSRETSPTQAQPLGKACPQCTFVNTGDAGLCEMCDLPF